jgi:hypothetical protein
VTPTEERLERGPLAERPSRRDELAERRERGAVAAGATPGATPRPPRERRPSSGDAPARPAGGERDREFWDVWIDQAISERPSGERSPEAPAAAAVPASASAGPSGGQARLFLNLGRKDNATVDEVAALLAEAGVNVPAAEIEVMNTHSYINVAAGDAERLCAAITGRDREGRRLSCEPARPRRR